MASTSEFYTISLSVPDMILSAPFIAAVSCASLALLLYIPSHDGEADTAGRGGGIGGEG